VITESALVEARSIVDEVEGKRIGVRRAVSRAMSSQAALLKATDDLDRRRKGEIVGLPWPVEWPSLSRRIGPLEPASLTVIAARPSVGKSIFGMQMARFLAGRGHAVLFVSRELSVVRLMRRNWVSFGANMMNLRLGKPTDKDIKCIGDYTSEAASWELMYDEHSRSVSDIAKEVEAQRPDIVIIDYMQRLAYDTEKEYAAVTRISNELQDLTLDTDIPVVCLSQLVRAQKGFEWKPPTMSDVRGSGAIEERAANMILLHRKWETKEEDAYGKKVKVGTMQSEEGYFIVAKCADGETGAPIPAVFEGAHMRVQERMT
jgi:replicative DNA helicase